MHGLIRYSLLLCTLAYVSLFPDSSSAAKSLECKQISRLIDQRTGILIWRIFPGIIFHKQYPQYQRRFTSQAGEYPFLLWRYLNSMCDGCSFKMSGGADIVVTPIERLEDIQGGPQLYVFPLQGQALDPLAAAKELQRRADTGESVLTSVSVRSTADDSSNEPMVWMSILIDRIAASDFEENLKVAIFEAFSGLRFWDQPDLRHELLENLKSGCLEGKGTDCRVLNFARFLYRNHGTLDFSGNSFDTAMSRICELYIDKEVQQ